MTIEQDKSKVEVVKPAPVSEPDKKEPRKPLFERLRVVRFW